MSPRRQLGLAVVACLVAAGLALFASSRTWLIEVTPRPAPLPAVSVQRTGGDLVPALPAMALVALAGAGGLLATRGRGRQVVAAVLTLSGLEMVIAALTSGGSAALWVATCAGAGAVLTLVGGLALLRGRRWPAMGSAYDRSRPRPGDGDMWEALDKRIDPTGDNTSQVSG
jgi:hypothetical protein